MFFKNSVHSTPHQELGAAAGRATTARQAGVGQQVAPVIVL